MLSIGVLFVLDVFSIPSRFFARFSSGDTYLGLPRSLPGDPNDHIMTRPKYIGPPFDLRALSRI